MSNHSYSCFFYHLVWSTKDRKPLITGESKKHLYNLITKVFTTKSIHVIAIGGYSDHIHILIQEPNKYKISELVCNLKSFSSNFMKEKYNSDFAWQNGYSAFTVDKLSLDRLKNYISKQEDHHEKSSFEEEYKFMFKRYVL